ncbi:MAG: photosystem I reaction center subunit PsaK [Cyanobacteriota bacterium]|nr:photosystem I reaction center subunit PsaK [Cyanobacteriota bacterium]
MIDPLPIILSAVPATTRWNLSVAIVMIACNLLAIALGRFAIKNPGKGPDLPVAKPALWEGFGLPELLATASLGHILGAGAILGLSYAGVL